MNLNISKYFTEANWVTFVIFLFCIQYIPLESRGGVSILKVGAATICAFLLLTRTKEISNAFQLFVIYYIIVLGVSFLYPQTFRWGTLLYLLLFITTYIYVYDGIVIKQLLTIDICIKFFRFMLLVYSVVLVIQQLFILVGIHIFPLINLVEFLDRNIGANSLSHEPSSSARIMTVAMLCLMRLYELKLGHKPSIYELYQFAKWPLIGFLWSILTMGSGTGFIALGLLAFYFVQIRYAWIIFITVYSVWTVIPYIDSIPLQRAYNAVLATVTMDTDNIIETDTSAAVRITPLINTITSLNLQDWHTWIGRGVDYVKNLGGDSFRVRHMGMIDEYGLISFIVLQITVFRCAIRKFFSLETLFWIVIFGMTLSNIAYIWGALMMFTIVRFFQCKNEDYR